MLRIQNLCYSILDQDLLKNIDWHIPSAKRFALIGPNGTGKTTLFRILTDEIRHYTGQNVKPKDYKIGCLPQEEIADCKGSILGRVLEGHLEILAIDKKIIEIHRQLESETTDQNVLLNRLGSLQDQYEILGGYQLESEAKAILSGLGFQEKDYSRSLSELSGGWRMRVYLARLLIQKPNLLLLDEPTNHLDIPSLEWLEQYLLKFEGSIVLISHDRFFIDRLVHEIYELEWGNLTRYVGNYHFYEREKAKHLALLRKKQEELKNEREHHQRFIDRFRYKASKAVQVQSRIKMLERMKTVELPPPPKKLHFKLKVEQPSYKEVLHIRGVSFRYESDWVLKDISLDVYRGERIALVGVNGAGKTTFTRLMTRELIPQKGKLSLGKKVIIGYHAQHQIDGLDLQATVLEEASAVSGPTAQRRIRDILGLFQFSGDNVFKKVEVLSGGEKARVSLAKVLLSPVNFLIMDEPTNHLDMGSKEALEDALSAYDGTLFLISHDRYFLDKLVTRVIEMKDGHLKIYEGNYSEYLRKREETTSIGIHKKRENDSNPLDLVKHQKRSANEDRRMLRKQCNRLEREISQLETKIDMIEREKIELEARLGKPETYQDSVLFHRLQEELRSISEALQESLENWEGLQVAYEKLRKQF